MYINVGDLPLHKKLALLIEVERVLGSEEVREAIEHEVAEDLRLEEVTLEDVVGDMVCSGILRNRPPAFDWGDIYDER
jgi:hypothetical protein